MMDRWHIEVSEQTGTQEDAEEVEDKIPYNIVNNYFSIGVVSDDEQFYTFGIILSIISAVLS